MFVIPNFNLSDILTFYKVIRIKTEKGAILPFICKENSETRSWQTPQHPTDMNVKITDTIWTEPKKINLKGLVPAKHWEEFDQLIKGGDAGKDELINSIATNIFGGKSGGELKGVGLYEITVLGGVYKNMALISLSRSEKPDVNCAYDVELGFQEVLKAEASTANLSTQQVRDAQAASTQETGQKNPIKV